MPLDLTRFRESLFLMHELQVLHNQLQKYQTILHRAIASCKKAQHSIGHPMMLTLGRTNILLTKTNPIH